MNPCARYVLAAAALGAAQVASAQDGSYRFFLDGEAFSPDTRPVFGRPGQLEAGDLILVGDMWLTVGSPGEYRFRSAPEGVRLELPGGSSRWVGVRVEPPIHWKTESIDGLASLSEEEVRGLWGLRATAWTRSCAAKAAWFDLSRLHLSLESNPEGQVLPELPHRLRYLEATGFGRWKSLRKLPDLVFLEALPKQRDFDLRLLSGMTGLRVLHIYGDRFRHTEALAALSGLQTFHAPYSDALVDGGFAASLARLREVHIPGTAIQDLSSWGSLRHLESVDASNTPLRRLPDGELPALRTLDIINTLVPGEAVARFRQAHPHVRVRHRWNPSLRETVAGGTRVRIDGAAACGPGGASAPYETTDRAEIASLLELLAVDEERSGGRCGCIGGPGIEVFQGERLLASVQLVCNRLLRWDGWPGDGELSEVPALFDWLAERGVTAPRDELLAERVALEAWAAKKRRATAGLSPRLLAAFQREDEVASHQPWLEERRWFAAALAAEFRGRPDRIRVLLRIFGAEESEADGYDWIDQLALDLLRKYPRRALEKACDAALLADDPQLRRGAARYRAAQPGGGG